MHKWLIEIKDWMNLGAELGAGLRLGLNLILGGVLSLYVRELYKRFSSTISNRDSFANVFPMLTLTTIVVIFVVRSSLALSLGLVGALSIVRFRAAIKEPEELVFLFFCISIGLALGADHKVLALVATFVVSALCVVRSVFNRRGRQQNLLLTVTSQGHMLGHDNRDLVRIVNEASGGCIVQRLDVDNEQVQLRAVVRPEHPEEVSALVDRIHAELPLSRVSYVNLESLL